MLKNLLYRLVYQSYINFVLRNAFKPIAKLFGIRLPLSISGCLKVDYQNVRFFLKTNPTCAVTQQLFYNGARNYEFTPLFAHLATKSDVFFDIGANIGYFTVLGEKLNPALRTFSFEPSHGPLHYLKNNLALNHLKNAVVVDKAIADQTGRLNFYDVMNPKYPWIIHQLNGSNSLQDRYGAQKQRFYPVDVTTIANIVQINKIEKLDLIKLDTECTEHQILKSSTDVIRHFRPIIICEVYEVIESQVEEIIQGIEGYKMYHYKAHSLEPFSGFNEINDTMNRNFVFCHESKLDLIRDFFAR
jgi:FkbM family methyltransferase